MLRQLSILSAVAAITLATPAFSQTVLQNPSNWDNNNGSVMTIELEPLDTAGVFAITGSYVNEVPNTGCQGLPYPVIGFYNENTSQIAFAVSWANPTEDCTSMTSWTGYARPAGGGLELKTKWHIISSRDGGEPVRAGDDVFVRVK